MNETGSGKIDQVFSTAEIGTFKKYLSALPDPITLCDGNQFFSVGQGHIMYSWFCKKIFGRIQELAGPHVQLLFGSYLHEVHPFDVHSDYYHKSLGEPYRAFLIPISVNHDTALVNRTNTIVFNEQDTYVDTSKKRSYDSSSWMASKTFKENNALMTHSSYLSHVDRTVLECLTVQNVLNWTEGSVLWWDERLLHVSDNFVLNDVQSKQALVVHTYVV